jgi:Ulp1 family protease
MRCREKGTMKSHFDSALKTNLVFRSTAIDAGEEQSFLAHKVETWNSKTGSSNTIKSLSLAANSAMPQLLQPKKRGNTKVSQMKGGDSNDEDSRRVIKSRNTRVSFGGTKDSTSIPRTHASVKGNDQSKRQLRNKSSNSSSQFKADKQYDQQLEDEEHGYSSGRLRNKPREPSPKPIIRFSESNDLGPEWDQPVHYPLTGKKRAVVEFSDLLRLDDGEFLNDNLLEFYTRYMEGTFEPKPKQVYCFNSHLYSRLTSGVRGRLNYEAVARWTKDVDLFEYDYLIVPINEYSHWYLAIICNAKNLLRTNGMPTEEVDLEAVDDTQDNSAPGPLPVVLNESSSGLKEAVIKALNPSDPDPDPVATADLAEGPSQGSPGSEVAQLQDLSLKEQLEVPDSQENPLSSAGEEHQPDNAVREQLNPMAGSLTKVPVTDKQEAQKTSVVNSSTNAASVRKGPRRKTAPVRKYAPNDTIVAILDSMGSARPAAISNLKAYLTAEAKDKKNIEIDRANIKGANMTNGIPQQNTWYDCGLYVCGYIRKFMQNPEEFGRKLLAQNFDLETDWPEMNALEMRDEMRTLLQNMARDQAEIRKKQKAEKKKAKKAAKIAQVASAAPAAGSSSPTPLNVTRPLAIPPTAPEESNTKEKTLEATHMDEKAAKPATPTPKDAQLPRSPTKIQQAQDAMPELKVVDNISNTPRKASRVPGSPSKFDWTKLPRSQGEKSPAETAVRFETSPEPGLSFMDGFRHKAKVNHIPALSAPKLESHNSLNAALSANPKFPSQQEKSSSELHASYKGTPTLFDAQRDFKQDDSSSVANSSPKKFATSRTMVNLEQETVDEVILLVPPPPSCNNDDDHFDSELSKGSGPVDLTQGEEVMHSHTRRKALPVKRISMNTGEASSQSALQSVKRVSSKAADTRAGNDIDGS